MVTFPFSYVSQLLHRSNDGRTNLSHIIAQLSLAKTAFITNKTTEPVFGTTEQSLTNIYVNILFYTFPVVQSRTFLHKQVVIPS